MADIETETIIDATGSLRVGFKNLTPEDMESLKALASSPHWKVYRLILEKALGEFTRASWKVNNVDDVVTGINRSGMAAGINFSINQLQILVGMSNAKAQKALEKEEKKHQPFVRG